LATGTTAIFTRKLFSSFSAATTGTAFNDYPLSINKSHDSIIEASEHLLCSSAATGTTRFKGNFIGLYFVATSASRSFNKIPKSELSTTSCVFGIFHRLISILINLGRPKSAQSL
jgi:hypothetical protein